jgi:hypothetical protein
MRSATYHRSIGTRLEHSAIDLDWVIQMTGASDRAKTLRRMAQRAAIVVAVGTTISVGARSFASTVELADPPISREVPESAELFGTGAVLIAAAASARRANRRRI